MQLIRVPVAHGPPVGGGRRKWAEYFGFLKGAAEPADRGHQARTSGKRVKASTTDKRERFNPPANISNFQFGHQDRSKGSVTQGSECEGQGEGTRHRTCVTLTVGNCVCTGQPPCLRRTVLCLSSC